MKINYFRPLQCGLYFAFVLFLSANTIMKAQTIQDLGELGASNLEAEFKAEIAGLNAEINQPPANANIEENQALIAGYNSLLSSFFNGADLQTEFITFLEGGVMQPNDDVNTRTQSYTTGNNLGVDNPLQDVITFVSNWNLRANDLSDLEETFEMIRTSKNQ